MEEIKAEKNDRGAAILLATNLENALEYAIRQLLRVGDGQYDLLFGLDSCPMGTFENKIRMAYALEIFGQETKANLNTIKAVRNAFAHTKLPIGFETEQVKAACELLTIPILLPPHTVRPKVNETTLSARERFHMVCEYLSHNLLIYGAGCFQGLPPFQGALRIPASPDERYEVTVRPRSLP
jgi:hypothetical protein